MARSSKQSSLMSDISSRLSLSVAILLLCFSGQKELLLTRRDQYKAAALKAKQGGDTATAMAYMKTFKVTRFAQWEQLSTLQHQLLAQKMFLKLLSSFLYESTDY